MPKLGDLGGSVDILRKMRDQLAEEEKQSRIQEERWDTFVNTTKRIVEACEKRDLEDLVTAARELKNRLRRPSVRRELARLEAKKEDDEQLQQQDDQQPQGQDDDIQSKIPAQDKEKKDKGVCKCAKCGQTIEGSKGDCIEGALCAKCGTKMKSKEKEDERCKCKGDDKKEKPDDQEEKQEAKRTLRRRKYLK